MSEPGQDVARALREYVEARVAFEATIREARAAGMSLRAIAKVADLSPEWVRRIAGSSEQD